MRMGSLALGRSIQVTIEGMKGIEFSGLDWLKEKDLLRVGEEICAIRQYSPMTTSFPLNKVDNESWDFWSPDDDEAIRIFDSFLSQGESDLDNELGYAFKEDGHQGELSKDSSPFEASDSGFKKDIEVFFSGAIDSFGGGSERSEFLVARGTPDDFSDEPGMLFDGHMFNKAVVVHEERATLGEFFNFLILRGNTLSLAGKGSSLEFWIKTVGSA
jgi:hypothetical protein